MPNTHSTLTSLFSDIADAIRGKTGSSATIVADDFPTAIANIPTGGGGGGSSGDAVRFIDYDGTILHSYSAEDFAALTTMPANPTHTGLTSQGWNWTLADAKAQVTAMGSCDIGQMYITDDGKTRVYISLVDSAGLSPYLGLGVNGTVVVDWGDNTATDTLTGTAVNVDRKVQHSYASTGNYVITLTVTSGTFAIMGVATNSNGSTLLTRTNDYGSFQKYYQNAIQKIELGANAFFSAYAFQNCYSLASVTIPKNSVTVISDAVFQNCYALTSITIPSGVATIGANVFDSCYSLVSIAMPNSITLINTYAFRYCYSLVNITIPKNVTSFGTYAFAYCPIQSITLPNQITSIANQMFYCCYSLKSITIPNNVLTIGSSSFNSCYSLANIDIPSGVTTIGASAFSGCRSLVNVDIPSSLTSFGANGVFNNCYSLSSFTIPNWMTSIGNQTFNGCYSLSSITIPSSVTSLGTQVFQYCYGMVEYHFLSTTPPTLANTNVFTGISATCKIYVPAASLTTYQEATNWSTYASYMVGE